MHISECKKETKADFTRTTTTTTTTTAQQLMMPFSHIHNLKRKKMCARSIHSRTHLTPLQFFSYNFFLLYFIVSSTFIVNLKCCSFCISHLLKGFYMIEHQELKFQKYFYLTSDVIGSTRSTARTRMWENLTWKEQQIFSSLLYFLSFVQEK